MEDSNITKIQEMYDRADEIAWEAQHAFCRVLIRIMKDKGIAENQIVYVNDKNIDYSRVRFRAYHSKNKIVIRYMCDDFKEGYYDCFSNEVKLGRENLMQLYDALQSNSLE